MSFSQTIVFIFQFENVKTFIIILSNSIEKIKIIKIKQFKKLINSKNVLIFVQITKKFIYMIIKLIFY